VSESNAKRPPPPDGLDRARDSDLLGRERHPWVRRALLTLLLAIAVAALLNLFGQASTTRSATGSAATMSLRGPEHLRGGLLFQVRFTIQARGAIKAPKLVLSPGWWDGFQFNTSEPSPSQEAGRNGNVVFSFNSLDAGQRLVFWTQWQANPTNAERRRQHAILYDGGTPLAHIDRTVTVLP
jgi:hypothetical protein